jgi:putative ATP-binding cassette transporter
LVLHEDRPDRLYPVESKKLVQLAMNFIRFLYKESGAEGRKIALVTLIGGVVGGLIVSIILAAAGAASDKSSSFRYLLLFSVALAAIIASKRYSLRATNRFTEEIVERVRLRITDKIRRTELQFFERKGPSQFFTLLTKETQTISSTAGVAINAASGVVMLVVAFGYIGYLSVAAFVLTLAAICVGVVAYRISLDSAEPHLRETIRIENSYFDLIHQLLEGFKELKINAAKNHDFYEGHLRPFSARVRDQKIATNNLFVTTTLITNGAFYVLLGLIIFVLPRLAEVPQSVVMKIAAVILFTFGPLTEVIGIVPFVARAGAAINAVEAMERDLDGELAEAPATIDPARLEPWEFKELEAVDLVFSYPGENGNPGYTVGPINLKITAGSIVYLMGGNGSGKSTFLKLLTGLYPARSGKLLINGSPVSIGELHRYQNLFSIIFTDFHLFDRLYGMKLEDEGLLKDLLRRMDLAEKTSYYEGRFSNLQLSTGQRKRLALIVAVLEQKQILVCDEWAADQDPEFRKHFYEVILPELSRQGRTIIAATHDDHYFHTADHLLKMEYGRLVAVETSAV